MSDDNLQRTIGALEAGVKEIANQQALGRKEQREDMNKIFKRLDEFPATCPTGSHLKEAVAELQKRPERLVGIGAALVAIFGAIGSLVLWLKTI